MWQRYRERSTSPYYHWNRGRAWGPQDWGCRRKRPIGDRKRKTSSPFLGHECSNRICNNKFHIVYTNVIANHYLKLAKDLYIDISPVQTDFPFPRQWDYKDSNVSPPPMSRPERHLWSPEKPVQYCCEAKRPIFSWFGLWQHDLSLNSTVLDLPETELSVGCVFSFVHRISECGYFNTHAQSFVSMLAF